MRGLQEQPCASPVVENDPVGGNVLCLQVQSSKEQVLEGLPPRTWGWLGVWGSVWSVRLTLQLLFQPCHLLALSGYACLFS